MAAQFGETTSYQPADCVSSNVTRILRKNLTKILKESGKYDSPEFAEFKQYNEFAESV